MVMVMMFDAEWVLVGLHLTLANLVGAGCNAKQNQGYKEKDIFFNIDS